MKSIGKSNIENIPNTDCFDNIFLFPKSSQLIASKDVEIIYMKDLLPAKKNVDIEKKISEKPAMYSNMYSAEEELKIFEELFEHAIKTQKKIHIVGITLKEETDILEEYYETLGYMREDINCFRVDFSIPLVTVSVNIENLIWKGSDYKAQRDNIFYMPPVRESSQNKAMFKGINRGVIAGIYTKNFGETEKEFLSQCISQEKILPLTLGKVLFYNLNDIGISPEKEDFQVQYS